MIRDELEYRQQSVYAPGSLKYLININIIFILVPETLIWMIFTSSGISLSPLHKTAILILILSYLMVVRPLVQAKVFYLSAVLTLSTFVSFLFNGSFNEFLESLEDVVRLLLLFATFLYFKRLSFNEPERSARIFNRFLSVSFAVISINLCLGSLGFGNEQRSLGIGTRGFFNAGNDISTITAIVAAFVLSNQYEKNRLRLLFYLGVFLFFAYLLNTKALIIGLVLILAILPVYGHTKRVISRKAFKRLMIFLVSFPFIIVLAYYALDQIHFWDPYFAFIGNFKNDSWITFLLSRRDENLGKGIEFAQNEFGVFNYLFGYSSGAFLSSIPRRAEIDPFEIFFYFGIVGVILVYSWFIKATHRSFKAGLNTSSNFFATNRGLFAANFVLFFQSIVAGHVFMSVLVCIYLGTINGLLYYRNE